MTTFVLTYEKISTSYQGAKIHNFCVSEKKMSLSAIANLINVSKSTVSREIKRNSNMYRHYAPSMRSSSPRAENRFPEGQGNCRGRTGRKSLIASRNAGRRRPLPVSANATERRVSLLSGCDVKELLSMFPFQAIHNPTTRCIVPFTPRVPQQGIYQVLYIVREISDMRVPFFRA